MADTMLDQKYEDILVRAGDTNVYRRGRIGSVNVVISCLPEPAHAVDAARIAQNMATKFIGIEAIMMTGFGSGVPSAGTRLGDLVVSLATTHDAELNAAQRAVCVLQKEVGADGSWLSSNLYSAISKYPDLLQPQQRPNSGLPDNPQLHYGKIGSESELQDQQATPKSVICFDAVAAGLASLKVVAPVVLGVTSHVDSRESGDTWKRYAAANAASYTKEIIHVMGNNLMSSVQNLRGKEKVVPPPVEPKLPPFEPHRYPNHGNAILLVIPTENEFKKRVLQEAFREQAPRGVDLHTISVPVESEVGEQPYNEAGVMGAHNRISNALLRLDAPEYQETFREKKIGAVFVASIENFIQIDGIDRPTDYGVVAIHNAIDQRTVACFSQGVTVSPDYVDRARRFGFDGNPNHGKVTVGRVLAANVPGLDKANWHKDLACHSRYDLLSDAVGQLPIPW
ncbi:hypothetical protein GP486_001426 [Trichoglossum hirsutum]|uniref:Nucleoside phosphorylase domain-containing protein n=1 Tax=Trichoglossum hirsutum TaxID=265104 RepID=A0A9P8LG33_9PEZI|nr:hypothetical protein GP486_001426 [Trichoglossum hirsutum]